MSYFEFDAAEAPGAKYNNTPESGILRNICIRSILFGYSKAYKQIGAIDGDLGDHQQLTTMTRQTTQLLT